MSRMNSLRWFHFSTLLCLTCCFLSAPASAKWKYLRAGNATDSTKTPLPGFALMGGGAHQDPAFKWLCERTNGGDFLVLSAHDDDAYMKKLNQEMQAVCPLNSAATLSFTNREDSSDRKVVEIIDHAENIDLAGGDQSNYVRYWQDTPVQDAMNRHISAGKPLGGLSAGLAIMGEFSFSSMIDTIHSLMLRRILMRKSQHRPRQFSARSLLLTTALITRPHSAVSVIASAGCSSSWRVFS